MSLRSRTKSIKQTPSLQTSPPAPIKDTQAQEDLGDEETSLVDKPKAPSPTVSQQAITQALASTAHLANLLPTGTLLAFQLLVPVFTNNGACDAATRPLTLALLLVLAASCCLACLTDSFRGLDGKLYYGFVTKRGMWLFDYTADASVLPDLTKYRLRFIDCVHAVLSVLVFGAVALRDRNVLSCFYPQPERETREVLGILPLGVGVICSLLFVVFPTTRHGIGYPVTDGK